MNDEVYGTATPEMDGIQACVQSIDIAEFTSATHNDSHFLRTSTFSAPKNPLSLRSWVPERPDRLTWVCRC